MSSSGVYGKGCAFVFTVLVLMLLCCIPVCAQSPEYRVYWVDAFNPGLKSAAEVDKLLSDVRAGNMNTVIVQMRRRGDTFYASSMEPWASDADPSFDALEYLIDKAHNGTPRVEVHCWFCTYPVWSSTSPPSPWNHPYNLHPDWLTQSSTGQTYDSSEKKYCFDPAVPAVEEHIYNVVMDVVNRYDVDGINFDFIRYLGTSWGYNPLAVSRFNTQYVRTGQPTTTDADWKQFRRDQVTALLRKIYVNTIAVKPNVKVSADTITWGSGPATEAGWLSTSAYNSVFQDWRAWMEEGILDLNVTMTYYDNSVNRSMWTSWINYQKTHKYDRHLAIGLGAWLNTIDNNYIQLNDTRVSYNGHTAEGQSFYSYNTPYSGGTGMATEFACHLASTECRPSGPFYPSPVPVPDMPWKVSPVKGHIKGTVYRTGNWVDGVSVTLTGPEERTTKTDGTGFYAFVHLTPGTYTVTIHYLDSAPRQAVVEVTAGQVATADFEAFNPIPPEINSVRVLNLSSESATIAWNTDNGSTSQVEFGLTKTYGTSTPVDKALLKSHSLTLTGLTPNTLYHCRVRSKNVSGLESISGDFIFMTNGEPPVADVIVDNADGDPSYVTTGTWTTSSTTSGMWGTNYQFTNASPTTTATATFTPTIKRSGPYNVYVWYNQGSNRSTAAPYTIYWGSSSSTVYVNQRVNGSQWFRIASSLMLDKGTGSRVVLSNGTSSSGVVMSDAVRFEYAGPDDITPPTTPTIILVDVVSEHSVNLTWQAATDDFGVVGYKIFVDGKLTAVTSGTEYLVTDLPANTSVVLSIAAFDARGNTSPECIRPAVTTYSEPPSTSTVICDKPMRTWQAPGLFVFTAVGGFGPGTVDHYTYAFDTNPVRNWTGTEPVWSSGTLTVTSNSSGNQWYLHLMGHNSQGAGYGIADLGPFYSDSTPPIAPSIYGKPHDRYVDHQEVKLGVSTSDDETGVSQIKYCIGTSEWASDIVGWTTVPPTEVITVDGVNLTPGQSYFISAQSMNSVGMWSGMSQKYVTAATTVDRISDLRTLPPDTVVILDDKVVSARWWDSFYIQEADRSAGVKVVCSSWLSPGNIVSAAGVWHGSNGIGDPNTASFVLNSSGSSPVPLGMSCISVGGTGAILVPFESGPYNVDLLVRVWGTVKSTGTGFFFVSDGSGANVKVYSTKAVAVGQMVGVTGVCMTETGTAGTVIAIKARNTADVTVYAP